MGRVTELRKVYPTFETVIFKRIIQDSPRKIYLLGNLVRPEQRLSSKDDRKTPRYYGAGRQGHWVITVTIVLLVTSQMPAPASSLYVPAEQGCMYMEVKYR